MFSCVLFFSKSSTFAVFIFFISTSPAKNPTNGFVGEKQVFVEKKFFVIP